MSTTQKKLPNYLGTGQSSGLLDFVKVNGYLVIPLALTDLRRRFVVTDRDGNCCAELEFSIFTGTNVQIHKSVLEVIERVRNGEIVPAAPSDAVDLPVLPQQPETEDRKLDQLRDQRMDTISDAVNSLHEITQLIQLTVDGLVDGKLVTEAQIDALHAKVLSFELRAAALILAPATAQPSILQRLRSLFSFQKREG